MKPSLALLLMFLSPAVGSSASATTTPTESVDDPLGAHEAIVWNGSPGKMIWEVGGDNWIKDGNPVAYRFNDDVTFTGVGAGTVTFSGIIGGGSMAVTGGKYTFAEANDQSRLVMTGELSLTGDAHVTFADIPLDMTGTVSLRGTSELVLQPQLLHNLGNVSLEDESTRLVVTTTIYHGDQVFLNDITGRGTVVLHLADSSISSCVSLKFNDNFYGTVDISGSIDARSQMTHANVRMQNWSNLVLPEGAPSTTFSSNIEIIGDVEVWAMDDEQVLTLAGAISGGADSTLTTIFGGKVHFDGDMSGYAGTVKVNGGRVAFGQGVSSSCSLVVGTRNYAEYGDNAHVTLGPDGMIKADGGRVIFGSNVQVTNGAVHKGEATAVVEANLKGDNPDTVIYSNVFLGNENDIGLNSQNGFVATNRLERGAIVNGKITVAGSLWIDSIDLIDSLISMSNVAGVMLNDVMLGKGTSIVRERDVGELSMINLGITLTTDHIVNAPDSRNNPLKLAFDLGGSASLSGPLTLAFDDELMRSVGAWSDEMREVELTLSGVSSCGDEILFDNYTQYFQPQNVMVDKENLKTGGVVVVTFDFQRPIPEPSAGGLGLLGVSSLLLRRRRRRKD